MDLINYRKYNKVFAIISLIILLVGTSLPQTIYALSDQNEESSSKNIEAEAEENSHHEIIRKPEVSSTDDMEGIIETEDTLNNRDISEPDDSNKPNKQLFENNETDNFVQQTFEKEHNLIELEGQSSLPLKYSIKSSGVINPNNLTIGDRHIKVIQLKKI